MTDEIRRALETRIAASAGSDERQARIRARIAALDKEEKTFMKRKWSMTVALALAVMLIVGTGLAAGIRLNLFGLLSQSNPERQYNWEQDKIKLGRLGEKNTLLSVCATAPESTPLDQLIQIQDAYYDGYVLLLGYIHGEDGLFWSYIEWTPTEEELEALGGPTLREDGANPFREDEGGEVRASLERAVQTGETWGRKRLTVSEGYDFMTTEGTKLWTGSTYYTEHFNDGSDNAYTLMQFTSPLPEEIRDKDTIVIEEPFTLLVEYYWFDGSNLYSWYGEDKKEECKLTITVGRDTDVRQARYASEKVRLNGTELTVAAEAVTPYLLHVTMSAEKPYFSPGKGGPMTWIAHNTVGQQCSMSAEVYGEENLELGAMMQKIIFGNLPSKQYTQFIYPDCSEDGTSKELWLDLFGEIPETVTMVVRQNDIKEATVTLRLAE